MVFSESTHGIVVQVEPEYLPHRSDPARSHHVWAYTVTITNQSPIVVHLRSRYWKITNGHGEVQEVSGDGVVGEQPVLAPNESYEYTSGCPLDTPSGFMEGHYTMRVPNGAEIRVRIPTFSLDIPGVRKQLN